MYFHVFNKVVTEIPLGLSVGYSFVQEALNGNLVSA